jgi:alpha-tubulin suppressor-like RCC1 family protein
MVSSGTGRPAARARRSLLHAFRVTDLSAGYNHSLALKSAGSVWAWGYNYYGQLGDGTAAVAIVPAQIDNLTNVVDITSGDDFSAAVKSDGTVYAWGDNRDGQLGDGTWTSSSTPVQDSNLTGGHPGGCRRLSLPGAEV